MKALKLPAIYFFSIICATVIFAQTPNDSYDAGFESLNNSNNMCIIENKVDPGLSKGMLDSVVVHFNDPNLEQAIRDALGKPEGDIYDADMATLTSLIATEKSISDLTGIEYAINLNYLDCYNNDISDITVLQYLSNLTQIFFNCNQIINITALENLTLLQQLNLYANQISNITPLQNLTNLTDLILGSNQISDVTPLQNLTNLSYLNIHTNQISDITALQNLINMNRCDLKNNQISDITALQNWTSISQLFLENNQITDITPLQNLTNLRRLLLTENQISYISALQNLTSLSQLELYANQITDIMALQNLTLLSTLYLSDNQISDITPLENHSNLRNLYISNNQIVDITALQNLTSMVWLELDANRLDNEDLLNLYNLDSLKTLYLNENPGIISGTAVQTLADNLVKINCEDIRWDGTCGVDPDKAVLCWVSPSDSALVGDIVTVQATATDSNQAQVQMKIDWGDGNVSDYFELKINASTFEFTHDYSATGNYDIKVTAINEHGVQVDWSEPRTIVIGVPTRVVNDKVNRINYFSLHQNYPNPFNPLTTIEYYLPKSVDVKLKIYNLFGQEIETLINSYQSVGEHQVAWVAKGMPSGIYFYRLKAGKFSETKKLILQK